MQEACLKELGFKMIDVHTYKYASIIVVMVGDVYTIDGSVVTLDDIEDMVGGM